MQLLYSPTSPYVRKVRIVAIEKGLDHRLTLVNASPLADVAPIAAHNPLGKVPTLIRDDGRMLIDSPVICAYLDSLVPVPKLIPEGDARWEALRIEAIADGVMDAAFSLTMEARRPEAQRSSEWIERWSRAIARSLDVLAADAPDWEETFGIGQAATAAALGYLDLRHAPAFAWRDTHPALAAWTALVAVRPSIATTEPPPG